MGLALNIGIILCSNTNNYWRSEARHLPCLNTPASQKNMSRSEKDEQQRIPKFQQRLGGGFKFPLENVLVKMGSSSPSGGEH